MSFRPLTATLSMFVLTSLLVSVGCGGASDDYVVVSGSSEHTSTPEPARASRHPEVPSATIRQAQQCLDRYRTRLSERSYAIQYTASATDAGTVVRVDLRGATLQDAEVEGCFRQAIARMVVPKETLVLRSSRPVSGGENMTREQRIPLGSESESENPFVFFVPFILETVGVEVTIEVLVGVVAAVATVVTDDDDTNDYCQKRYQACLMTSVADRTGSVQGETLCLWCRQDCIKYGSWPLYVTDTAKRRHVCK